MIMPNYLMFCDNPSLLSIYFYECCSGARHRAWLALGKDVLHWWKRGNLSGVRVLKEAQWLVGEYILLISIVLDRSVAESGICSMDFERYTNERDTTQ